MVEDEGVLASAVVGLGDFVDFGRLTSEGSSGNSNDDGFTACFVFVVVLFDEVSVVVPWSAFLLLLGSTKVAVVGEDNSGVLTSCTDLRDDAEDGGYELDGAGEFDDCFAGFVAVVGEEISEWDEVSETKDFECPIFEEDPLACGAVDEEDAKYFCEAVSTRDLF